MFGLIRNSTTRKTAGRSPLDNQGCAVPLDNGNEGISTLVGSPLPLLGHPSWVLWEYAVALSEGARYARTPRLSSGDAFTVLVK